MRAEKEKTLRLLKTARGQIDGVLRMVEEDRYCIDISHQIMAAEAILKKCNKEILRAHIEGCVADAFGNANENIREQNVKEIIGVIDALSR